MNSNHKTIKTLLDWFLLTEKDKQNGIYFVRDDDIKEFKIWYSNRQLRGHHYFKDDKFDGEYKWWLPDGELWKHCLYKDGKIIKDYLE